MYIKFRTLIFYQKQQTFVGGIHTIHEIHAIQHITACPNRLRVPPTPTLSIPLNHGITAFPLNPF